MNLAEVCRERFPHRSTIALWVQAELIAMATDLAEFIGAALGSTSCSACRSSRPACSPASSRSGSSGCRLAASAISRPSIAGLVGVIVAGFAFQVVHAQPSTPRAS